MKNRFPELRFYLRRHRQRGMTLTEIMITAALVAVILAGVYSVVYTGMLVAVKGLSINATGTSSRLATDRINLLLQSAYEPPTLINDDGTPVTNVTATTEAAGIRFYRYVAAPYVITIPTDGLAGTATELIITADSKALEAPPQPVPGDALVINTTILISGQANQLRAVVQNSSVTSTSGTRTTYKIKLTSQLTGYAHAIPNDSSTVTATLIRPTALVVRTEGDKRSLYLYESFPNTADLDFDKAQSRRLTDQIAAPVSGGDTPERPFSFTTISTRRFLQTALQVHDTRYDRYLSLKRSGSAADFSSFTRVESRTPFKCDPNQL